MEGGQQGDRSAVGPSSSPPQDHPRDVREDMTDDCLKLKARVGGMRRGPAMTNVDVLGCMVVYVPEKQFLFFAPACRAWRAAWGQRPTLTSFTSLDSSVSQLQDSFGCGLPRNRNTVCSVLARYGKLGPLKYARAEGCPSDETASFEAAGQGHLSTLQWLRENGCPWNELTCSLAARGGHLPVLQ
ncbi:unnamed protein product, partial [Scytosiphon promiscuus]